MRELLPAAVWIQFDSDASAGFSGPNRRSTEPSSLVATSLSILSLESLVRPRRHPYVRSPMDTRIPFQRVHAEVAPASGSFLTDLGPGGMITGPFTRGLS
jgi:hypothetical protein